MKLSLKTLSFGSLAALALLAASLTLVKSVNAGGDRGHFEQLNLTEAQSTQIEAIRSDTRSQIEAVLTPEQQASLDDSESFRRGLKALDLSDDQRSQIRSIHASSREQIEAVLTEEQRQQLLAARDRRGHRGRHLEDLNLTEAQSAQIEAIRSDARSQMAAVLTEEQRATLGDEPGRRAWRSLDLSEEQRQQLQTIHAATHEQIEAVLTAAQRQQLQERHHGRFGDRDESQPDQ
ncbi:MAG: hypothetical protein F6J97_24435 [Leptolyngbya sp. SIO4C1]|nr:hypothetical protein [Leptolyngbya sp. SIO4C1]